MAACRQQASPPDKDDAADLVADLSGVWATSMETGTDNAETVYMLDPGPGGGLRLMRDKEWIAAEIEDVDPLARTIAVRSQTRGGPRELLTFKLVHADDDPAKPFHLRLTYGNGQLQTLGYVRRLTRADRTTIDSAARAGDASSSPVIAATQACTTADTARARLTCESEAATAASLQYRHRADLLRERFPPDDVRNILAAAERQLDACPDANCLRKAYEDWSAYLDENYDISDAY